MESLNPCLSCLLHIRLGLQSGESLRQSLHRFIAQHQNSLSDLLHQWLIFYDQGQEFDLTSVKSVYRRQLLRLFRQGLNGRPVSAELAALESEVELAIQSEIDQYVSDLPLRAMLPLLFFQFPAYLLLLLGPILLQFIKGLQ